MTRKKSPVSNVHLNANDFYVSRERSPSASSTSSASSTNSMHTFPILHYTPKKPKIKSHTPLKFPVKKSPQKSPIKTDFSKLVSPKKRTPSPPFMDYPLYDDIYENAIKKFDKERKESMSSTKKSDSRKGSTSTQKSSRKESTSITESTSKKDDNEKSSSSKKSPYGKPPDFVTQMVTPRTSDRELGSKKREELINKESLKVYRDITMDMEKFGINNRGQILNPSLGVPSSLAKDDDALTTIKKAMGYYTPYVPQWNDTLLKKLMADKEIAEKINSVKKVYTGSGLKNKNHNKKFVPPKWAKI